MKLVVFILCFILCLSTLGASVFLIIEGYQSIAVWSLIIFACTCFGLYVLGLNMFEE